MREILFRGKRFFDGEWVDGSLFIDEKKDKHEILVGYVNYRVGWEVVPETVGQFTGLTDKNGKKIFEGDIMPVWEQGEEYHYKVVYNGDCFMLSMLDSEQGSYPLSTKNLMSEVIGNIHDNPELLEVGNA